MTNMTTSDPLPDGVAAYMRTLHAAIASEIDGDHPMVGWTVEVADPVVGGSWLIGFHPTEADAESAAARLRVELEYLDGQEPVSVRPLPIRRWATTS